ncbi:MAG: hypothetical protein JSR21_05335 [Proteobacteria bacterium]|nr:hypothetical protein [Pseudomonadota bacterium]
MPVRFSARSAGLLAVLATLQGGCACVPCSHDSHGGPFVLHDTWMIGVERMIGDVDPRLPFTNRLLADLAAMPNVQSVYIGTPRNDWPFSAGREWRIRLAPWLYNDAACMTATYTVTVGGQIQGTYGLVTPRLAAGTETDLGCIDRFATAFYLALVRQGF